jgi:hypothetical protein
MNFVSSYLTCNFIVRFSQILAYKFLLFTYTKNYKNVTELFLRSQGFQVSNISNSTFRAGVLSSNWATQGHFII